MITFRKLHIVLLIMAHLLVFWTIQPQVASAEAYHITVAKANVRACPRLNCRILAQLPRNTEIEVLETVQGGAYRRNTLWLRLNLDGQEGYVHSLLATPTAPAPPATPTVLSFSVNPTTARIGDTVTISWVVTGAQGVSIRIVQPDGRFGQWFNDQPLTGSLTYTVPATLVGTSQFLLVTLPEIVDGGPLPAVSLTVTE